MTKELRKGRHACQNARIKKAMNSETVWKLYLLYSAEKRRQVYCIQQKEWVDLLNTTEEGRELANPGTRSF